MVLVEDPYIADHFGSPINIQNLKQAQIAEASIASLGLQPILQTQSCAQAMYENIEHVFIAVLECSVGCSSTHGLRRSILWTASSRGSESPKCGIRKCFVTDGILCLRMASNLNAFLASAEAGDPDANYNLGIMEHYHWVQAKLYNFKALRVCLRP